jgi:chromosome segregation ATPase
LLLSRSRTSVKSNQIKNKMKRLKTFVSPRSRTTIPRASGSPRKVVACHQQQQQHQHQQQQDEPYEYTSHTPSATCNIAPPTVSVDQLKEQVFLLRERIDELDDVSSTSASTSIDDSTVDPFETARNQQQLTSLQSQFHYIQTGLSKVEQERRSLRESKAILEAEKRKIQRQLGIREKEVMTLVKRCQSQDEKMREATKLRAAHNDLSTQLEGLKSTLSTKDEELSQVEKLQKELDECQQARQALKTRLVTLKKDHDDVVDTLNSCFQNMKRLQEKQQDNDQDRKRDTQRAELMMEKERLGHQEAVNELNAEMEHRQERIHQMEVVLRDNMATSTTLRRERVDLKESLESAQSQKEESAQRLAAMQRESQTSQSDYAAQIQKLRATLNDKDSVIETLEIEVSTCMDKLMALSEEVEVFREEQAQREREGKESIEQLEHENWTLKEQASTKDLEVTVLSTSVSILEASKIELLEQLTRLEARVKELQEENAFIMDLEGQLDDVNFSMIEAQEDNTRVQEVYDQAVADIEREFHQQRDMWNEMEKGLVERVTSLENEKSQIELQWGAQLNSATEENATLRKDLEATKLAAIKFESSAQMTASNQSEMINDLQVQLEQQQAAVVEKDGTIVQLRTEVQVARQSFQATASDENEKHAKIISSLQRQLEMEQTISDSKACDFQRVSKEMQTTQASSQKQVSALKGQLHDQEKIVASLTERLNEERREKINAVKVMRGESDSARQSLREELNQANDLLHEKRKEVETLQLDLVSALSKGEKEQAVADRTINTQGERLESLEQDLQDQQRQLQRKTSESERLKAEIVQTKEHMQTELSSLMDRAAENERKAMSLEVELRRERSSGEGKESALTTMGTEMGAMRQELTDKERTVVSLQREVENLRTSLDQDLNQRDVALSDQVHQLSLLSTMLSAKQTLLESLTGERDSLSDELKTKGTDIAELTAKATTQNTCIEDIRSKLASEQQMTKRSQERVQELESGLQKAMNELAKRSAERNSLSDQVSALKDDMLVNEDLLKSMADKATLLEEEIQRLTLMSETTTNTVDELRNELKEAHATFDSELSSAQKKQAEQDRVITSLQADLRQGKLEIHQREANISTLTGELESLRFKFDQDAKVLANEIAEKEEIIASRDSELASIKSSLEHGTEMLGQEVKTQTAKVCSLQKAISNLEYEMEERERKARSSLSDKESQVADLQNEVRSLTEQKAASDEYFRASLSDREGIVENLQMRIDSLQSASDELTSTSQAEIRSFKHQLQKTEIDLAISQDELRDVQMIDLKEAEETIESLESSLQTLRTKARSDETSSNALVSDLHAKIDQLESKLNSADKGSEDTKHLYDKTVSKMQGEVDVIKQENEALNDELKQQFDKLNERHATISALTADKAKLERAESRLRGEIASLEEDCKKAWEEQEKAAYALEREIGKQFANRQDEDIEFQKRQSGLQTQLEASQSKVAALMKRVADAEETIEDRTTLLADMVAHNKETEEQKESYLADLNKAREEAAKYKSDLEEAREEFARLRSASTKKEDQLLEAIQHEREMREVAEVELENAHARLHNSNRDDKELSQLEKENETLRDKVRRQEAYLQRKLQKDKVLRERITKPSGIATPSRTNSVRKKPLSSAKKGRLTPLSENLFADELDELLG